MAAPDRSHRAAVEDALLALGCGFHAAGADDGGGGDDEGNPPGLLHVVFLHGPRHGEEVRDAINTTRSEMHTAVAEARDNQVWCDVTVEHVGSRGGCVA